MPAGLNALSPPTMQSIAPDSTATLFEGDPRFGAPVSGGGRTALTRVCHVSLGLCTGGLERLLVDFARFHDLERFELHFVAMHNVGRPAEDIRRVGCAVHVLPQKLRGRMGPQRELSRLFREIQPDLVHTHNAYPHFHATLAARWTGVPAVVNTRHGQRFGQSSRARWQFWLAAQLADRIVSVSEDAARLCRQEDWVSERKVGRIWNGIDIERFRYQGPARRPVAISVARLSAEKDFPTLLRAMSLAAPLVPELRLQIVGDGAERKSLEALCRDLRIVDRVEFLGERNDVPELLAEAGFFVTSSLTEGVSLTLLEAMAVGLPVVATAVGGNPEVVVDGSTGVLVPAADPDVLAAAMVRLVRAPDSWPELGRRGRDRVLRSFDVRQMVQGYEALYDDVLRGRKHRQARSR